MPDNLTLAHSAGYLFPLVTGSAFFLSPLEIPFLGAAFLAGAFFAATRLTSETSVAVATAAFEAGAFTSSGAAFTTPAENIAVTDSRVATMTDLEVILFIGVASEKWTFPRRAR